jgi:hypothetical protein
MPEFTTIHLMATPGSAFSETIPLNAHSHEHSDAKESSSLFLDGDRCECNGCRHSGRGGHVARTQKQVREYIGS